MPIPLGVLAVAGAGAGPVAAGNAYEHLETEILTGTQASVTFSNLDTNYGSTYQHLQLRIVARSDRTANALNLLTLQFNSDTASNYRYHRLSGNGSTVTSDDSTATTFISAGVANTNGANNSIYGVSIIDILDPFETTKFKTSRLLTGFTTGVHLESGLWRSTNAVTTIKLEPEQGFDFVTGTRISLYGMRSS
jgi:hypothetical protein